MDNRRWFAHSLGVCVAVGALSACGANATVVAPVQTEGTGPAETVFAVTGGEQAACVTERKTLEIALEAFTVMNGAAPATLDELVPDFLRESVSPRWSIAPDPTGVAPVLTGIGMCEGA